MKLKLIEKKDEAKGTKSFFFQPSSPVTWNAGQYFYFTIMQMKYPDPRGNTRHFTISSSPTEGGVIRMTTRMREQSGFKKDLDEVPVGGEIDGEGPNGTFFLDETNTSPNVYIAGGIGITPFRSIIKNAVDKNLQIPIYLIYSNSIPEEIAFRDELTKWSEEHPNIKVEMTISKPEESSQPWSGRTGRVDDKMIKELLDKWQLDKNNVTFWISGPPVMIDAMEAALGKLEITSDKIRSEKFTGY